MTKSQFSNENPTKRFKHDPDDFKSESNPIYGLLNRFPMTCNTALMTNRDYAFSPMSLSMIMSMLLPGAKRNTLAQLRQGLGLRESDDVPLVLNGLKTLMDGIHKEKEKDQDFTLGISNRMFIANETYATDATIKEFEQTLSKYFEFRIEKMDFSNKATVAVTINNWVASETKGKVRNVMKPADIHPFSELILVNTVYLKVDWKNKFKKSNTRPGDFYNNGTNVVKVKKMSEEMEISLSNLEKDLLPATVACLPYSNDRHYMVVIRPNKENGLGEVEERLGKEGLTFGDIFDKVIATKVVTVRVRLPKFTMKSEFDFTPVLKSLGIEDVFSKENANLQGLSGWPMYIDRIMQATFIDVDENGTEAAACSCMFLVPIGIREDLEFDVDRPFIAYIYDKETKAVLFVTKRSQFQDDRQG